MKVVLDVQHVGKPSAPRDRGAPFPDGSTEAAHAARYADVAEGLLRSWGVTVLRPPTPAEYTRRNRWANDQRADLYVACHCNGGDADYALTEYVTLNSGAAALALLQACDDELRHKAVGPKRLFTGDRGHVCIGACAMPAVIYEPYFNAHPKDDTAVGRCLAIGIADALGIDTHHQEDDDMTPEQAKAAFLEALQTPLAELADGAGKPRSLINVIDEMNEREARQGLDLGKIKGALKIS